MKIAARLADVSAVGVIIRRQQRRWRKDHHPPPFAELRDPRTSPDADQHHHQPGDVHDQPEADWSW